MEGWSKKVDGREEFDFLIVGGGSAGCVLANRLSADGRNRVCLIESGSRDTSLMIHVPLGFVRLFDHKSLNWCFRSVPQAHLHGRSIFVPRGRVLGGTSSINGMVYMRGHPLDYEDWGLENPGWSYRDVMPYFIRSENNRDFPHSPYHGADGPLGVTLPGQSSPVSRLFLESARRAGFEDNNDFNGARQEGFGLRQLTQRDGRRHSAAASYLRDAEGRRNLSVLTGATVDRIIFDGTKAVAVEFLDAQRRRTLLAARREIVIAAGTIGSPGILERSGIGDGERLRALGVEVVADLPGVGRNLQDHPTATIQVDCPSAPSYGISLRALPSLVWSGADYLLRRRGLFASNILEAGGFVRSDPSLDRPDLQFSFTAARKGSRGHIGLGYGFSLTPILMRPRSRGSVHVASTDPHAHPDIDFNAFADPHDLDVLVRGVRLARRILEAEPLHALGGREEFPGAGCVTDEEIADFIRRTSATAFHPIGTCRMGRGGDAVVDGALRVKGVEGLRVVDASVMPSQICGNTNGPAIMIAEKASDIILGRPPLPRWEYPDERLRDTAQPLSSSKQGAVS